MQLDENNPFSTECSPGRSRGSLAASLAPHELVLPETDPYPRTTSEHRARLQRYVTGTVAGCVALCAAALVRVSVAHWSGSGVQAPRAAVADSADSHASNAAAAPPPVPSAPVSALANPEKSPAERPTGNDREAARRALEGGRPREAIVAAERAAAGDPGDAEAWLILGAAQSELGHVRAARDAYRTCVKSAKHGPVRECGAMLR